MTGYSEVAGKCWQCHQKCMTCNGVNINNCLTCDPNLQRDLEVSTNTCECKLGYVEVADSCTKCHYTCLTCTGSANNNCLSCDLPNSWVP